MILLREIQEHDIDALEHFAKIPGFINLPDDRDLLKEKILRSNDSFRSPNLKSSPKRAYSSSNTTPHGPSRTSDEQMDGKYLFVAEDLETHKILGTSMIAAQHGTLESPHFYFEVGNEEKRSDSINTGFIHGTLSLKYDTDGPSEIGGLVIDPQYRNAEARLGRQISFVRFLFLGVNPQRFKKKIIAELLPPLNKKGQSPLWEAVGRRFTNMDYWEADQLCQKNKEFIFSLFPSEKIYTTLLTAEARNAIGRVGKDTEPVVHMLKKIGFRYMNQVDPFDGGPHFWANVDDLLPLKNIVYSNYDTHDVSPDEVGHVKAGLLCKKSQKPGEFRALAVQALVREGRIQVQHPEGKILRAVLNLHMNDELVFMPYY